MVLWKLWKKVQGRVEFELSVADALCDEFALLFVPEDFPCSCEQLWSNLYGVSACTNRLLQADYFLLSGDVWLAVYLLLGFAMSELTSR